MGTERVHSWTVLVTMALSILALALIALVAIFVMSRAIDRAEANTKILKYNAKRGDCIRDIQGANQSAFQQAITELIDANGDRPVSQPIVDRMKAAAKINYADVVKAKCPPAIEVNP